jgi:methyl-accepting chemotaxis protein
MNPNEVLNFLLPQFGDTLQVAFFTIILAMIGFTVISAHRTARPASWEHKWNRGTPNDPTDDLDIEHGSVTDLWHAVATAPEKLAEVMPGMLLVVGLLGTFLGLGLALNHASSILGQANIASAGAAADSMQDLLGLLQGLGTKFKTSTWGILGFVLLKIWSEVTRFEEKRLAWVIGKVKDELESRKHAQARAESAKQEALFASIGRATKGIVEGFTREVGVLIKSNETLHLQHLQQLHGLEQQVQGVRTDLGQVAVETQAMRSAMSQFTEGTQEVVVNMGAAAQRMASGADKVGAGATQLVDAIQAFETQFTGVLDNVRVDLGKAIHDMSAQASQTLEKGSAQLGDATREISTALGELSKDVKDTMNEVKTSINRALDIQLKASSEFTLSSQVLNENIEATTGVVTHVTKSIEDGLSSIATANRNMRSVAESAKTSSDILEQVVSGLQGLPDAQQALVAALKPLPEIVGVQQAMLEVLRAIQDEKKEPASP